MPKLNHNPRFDTTIIENHYSTKDGVPVKYVCTTDLSLNGVVLDIFYRDTPHPEFGNRYFGIGHDGISAIITNADDIENHVIHCIEDEGILYYSRYRHDFVSTPNGYAIDGGRDYTKTVGNETGMPKRKSVIVRDGEFELWH